MKTYAVTVEGYPNPVGLVQASSVGEAIAERLRHFPYEVYGAVLQVRECGPCSTITLPARKAGR